MYFVAVAASGPSLTVMLRAGGKCLSRRVSVSTTNLMYDAGVCTKTRRAPVIWVREPSAPQLGTVLLRNLTLFGQFCLKHRPKT